MRLPLPTWFIVLVVLPACEFSANCGNIDMEKASSLVTKELGRNDIEVIEIKCPEAKIEEKAGVTFDCGVKVKDYDGEILARFTQKDDKGNVLLTFPGVALSKRMEAGLAEEVKKQIKNDVTVDCGPRVHKVAKGVEITCTAKHGEKTVPVTVQFQDDKGTLRWKLGE